MRRAKLYYLRERVGKATRVAEQEEQGVKPRVAGSVPPPQEKKHKESKPEEKPVVTSAK